MTPPPPRIRRDPRDPQSARARVPAGAAGVAATAAPAMVEDAAPFVLAVTDLDAGRLSRDGRALMGAARRLADALGGGVALVACLPGDGELRFDPRAVGVDRLVALRAGPGRDPSPAAFTASVAAAFATLAGRHLLVLEGGFGGELGRRVAARLHDRAAADVRRVEAGELSADMDGGRIEVRRPLPRVLILARSSFAPLEPGRPREARPVAIAEEPGPALIRDRGLVPPDPATIPLAEAELIIGAGNGLRDWGAFHAAARLLGAAEAGSRVVCDAGLLPRDRQVGVSGLLVAPRCYLAFGIAGASQHLQGIAGAERVIAVNTDLHADMIKRADLAIVADAQAVLPALVRRAAERGLGRSASTTGGAAAAGRGPSASAPASRQGTQPIPDAVVLVSKGRNPVSRRARPADLDARALELALSCGTTATALHAGPADAEAAALRACVGAGADRLALLETAPGADVLPALEAWLRARQPRLIAMGLRAEAGEGSGMLPFLLAERLDLPLGSDIVAIEDWNEEGVRLVQAGPGGRRRRLEAPLPLIVTVGPAGPEPRLAAAMRAARAIVRPESTCAPSDDARAGWRERPGRPRPKRLAAPGAASVDTGRRELVGLAPEAAAEAILDFLERDALIATAVPGRET